MKGGRKDFLPLLVIASVFAALAAWSWRCWPDLLVDVGHQAYAPWRVLEGDVLYRDFAYIMGPLSVLVNAGLYRIFGVSLTTLIIANLTVLAGIVVLLYGLLRQLSGRWCAAGVIVVFLTVLGFSQYVGVAGFNYVLPYRHEMTHGMLLCVVLAHVLFHDWRGRWPVAGVLCGLLALLKLELTLAGGGMAALVWWQQLLAANGRTWQLQLVRLGTFGLAAAVPMVAMVAWFALPLGWSEAVTSVFSNWRYALAPPEGADQTFYISALGMDQPLRNAIRIAQAFALEVVLVALVVALACAAKRLKLPRAIRCCLIASLTSAGLWFAVPADAWRSLGVPFMVLATALFLWHSWRWWQLRQTLGAGKAGMLAAWALFSTLCLFKMGLRCRLPHYGFVLAAPAFVLICLSLLHELPLRFRRCRCELVVAMSALLVVLALRHLQITNTYYSRKTQVVNAGGDRIRHDPTASPRHLLLPKVLDYLRLHVGPDESLFVAPEGVSLNYFLRRRQPIPYYQLNPWEMGLIGGEAAVLEALQTAQPDWVVLLTVDMKEYGYGFFGQDYGQKIVHWMSENYDLQQRMRAADDTGTFEFDALILYRKPSADQ